MDTRIIKKLLYYLKLYLRSLIGSFRTHKLFKDLETYCMFIGYARSGHSLIGALLDAHPNIIIAHELDALKYINKGFSRDQIFYLLLWNSQVFAARGRKWMGYSYSVKDQWQGRFTQMKIIGDKKGEKSVMRISNNPALLDILLKKINMDIKFIHIIRNPYDTITTKLKFRLKNKVIKAINETEMTRVVEDHFRIVETVQKLKERFGERVLDIMHEDFVNNPILYLKQMCVFLNVPTDEDYINACASIVFEQPHQSRHDIKWPTNLVDMVKDHMSQYAFLKDYTFNN